MRSAMDDESLGIRLHEVNRQRAVDRAVERLRYGLRADWHYLTSDDHASLRLVIGELWAMSSREEWDGYHFSKLDFDDTRCLVSVGSKLRGRHTAGIGSLDAVVDLLREASDRYGHDRVPAFARAY